MTDAEQALKRCSTPKDACRVLDSELSLTEGFAALQVISGRAAEPVLVDQGRNGRRRLGTPLITARTRVRKSCRRHG